MSAIDDLEEFSQAIRNLFEVIAHELGIDRLVEWISERLLSI